MERFINRRLFLQLSGMTLALSVADPLFARLTGRQRVERLRRLARAGEAGIAPFMCEF